MALSKAKKRAYGAVIGVGLCALVGSWIFDDGGAPATARAASSERPRERATAAIIAAASVPDLQAAPFPTGLSAFQGKELTRDPFTMSALARSALTPPPEALKPEDAAMNDPTPPGEAFRQRHQLSAVMRVGNSRVAVLNGILMTVGQTVDECELTRIDASAAHFDCPDGSIVLEIADPLKISVPD
jgi:hypothetical protein